MSNRKMNYDDYTEDIKEEDYEEEIDDKDEEDPATLNEKYWDDEYYCPFCGARKVKYKEWHEAFGSRFSVNIIECPSCGN